MRKIITIISCSLLAVSLISYTFTGCNKASDNVPEGSGETDVQHVEQSTNAVINDKEEKWCEIIMLGDNPSFLKLLGGRQALTDKGVTCDWSCDGIEFNAECEGDIAVKVDIIAGSGCYFKVYIDGKEWQNGKSPYYVCFADFEEGFVIKDIPSGTHNIRIVKATGYTLARAELLSIQFENGAPVAEAPADKELFIEYVGDSIFCGWGVVKSLSGAYNGTYQSQDGTLAIPYLLSEELDADYSVIAVSGQGAAWGDPNIENAYKYASFARDRTNEYDFERKADIVVVNVGTNDCASAGAVSPDAFAVAYKRMLGYIRDKNGEDCIIIAVYNMMNDGYGTEIEKIIDELGGTEENYYVLKADRCSKVLSNAGHPTARENEVYSQVIGNMIKSIIE